MDYPTPAAPAATPAADPAIAQLDLPDYHSVEHWDKEMNAAKKWMSRWHALVKKIEAMYLVNSDQEQTDQGNMAKYNLFWANVQTLLSSLYGRMPKVEADRTNLDPNDDVARVAALILERIFNFEFNNVEDSPFYTYQECIQDRLVSGIGICWARYDFTEDKQTLEGVDGAPGVEIPIITEELAPIDYVNWEDFRYSPCKRWQDKRWIARRCPMAKGEVAKRFGPIIANDVPYGLKGAASTRGPSQDDPIRASPENQADIWEIWCSETKSVYWYIMGYDKMLDMKQDPLRLRSFWPCKRPLVGTVLPKAFLPRPDYMYAKSQYTELNIIATRTKLLTEALKVIGVYDKTSEGVQRMLNQATMNQLIPVDNWALFAEKGGIKGAVDWFPLEMVVNTLEKLTVRKTVLVGEVYEIMGISDIQRGQASTRETATTQKLKAQYGQARVDKTAQEIARFITESTRLRAEIICTHWQPQTILERSQIMQTPDAEFAEAAIQLLKNDPSVIARITVSADTVASPDWDLEKQQRIDFLQAISQFIGMAMPVIQSDPTTAPYMIQVMQWAATGFKGAKQIEGVLDQAFLAMQKNLANPKPKPPSPQEQKDLASAQKSLADAKKLNVEILELLVTNGIPLPAGLQMLENIIPPVDPNHGGDPTNNPGRGMVPPQKMAPSSPRPQVQ